MTACVIEGLYSGNLTVTVETASELVRRGVIVPAEELGKFKIVVDESILWKYLRHR